MGVRGGLGHGGAEVERAGGWGCCRMWCQVRGQLWSVLGAVSSRGWGGGGLTAGPPGLTIARDVGADALVTLLPKATVAPGVADPVVGGSGQNDEGVGQEAQHGAPALKAPLHPHARGLLPRITPARRTHALLTARSLGPPPACPSVSCYGTAIRWLLLHPCLGLLILGTPRRPHPDLRLTTFPSGTTA